MCPRSPFPALLSLTLVSVPLACQKKAEPHPTASVTASASAAPSGSTAAPMGVRVEPRLPAQNSVRNDVVSRRFEFDPLEPGGPSLVIDERVERKVKVLAVGEDAVTKIEIAYGKATTSVVGEKPAREAISDPRAGKTYVVSRELGQLQVAAADGTSVDEAIAAVVTADQVVLGLPFPLPSLLPERPIVKGDDFDLSHDAVLALLPIDADGDFDVTRIRLVFEGLKSGASDQALFTLETRFWGVHGGRRIEVDVKGQLSALMPAAWPQKLTLEGPAKLLANADDQPASARPGRAKIEIASSYE